MLIRRSVWVLILLLLACILTLGVRSANAAPGGLPALEITSTPGEDGSIIHVVRENESLASIAAAYGISMSDIRGLNAMAASSNLIFPGQKLVIRPPQPPTETPTLTPTVPRPTRTATQAVPTRTPRPTRTATATLLPSPTPDPLNAAVDGFWSANQANLLYAMVAFCAVGLIWTLWAGFRKRG